MTVMKFAQLEHTKMLFPATEMVPSHPTDPVELRRLHYQTPGTIDTPHFTLSVDHFLARNVMYTSRAYATMSVSVCLSVCPSVCDGSALAHYS